MLPRTGLLPATQEGTAGGRREARQCQLRLPSGCRENADGASATSRHRSRSAGLCSPHHGYYPRVPGGACVYYPHFSPRGLSRQPLKYRPGGGHSSSVRTELSLCPNQRCAQAGCPDVSRCLPTGLHLFPGSSVAGLGAPGLFGVPLAPGSGNWQGAASLHHGDWPGVEASRTGQGCPRQPSPSSGPPPAGSVQLPEVKARPEAISFQIVHGGRVSFLLIKSAVTTLGSWNCWQLLL